MKFSRCILVPLYFATYGSAQVNPPISYKGDTIEYENYVIYQCPTQSDIVKSVLAHLKVFLPVVIEELEGGEPLGTAPYRAFFGTEFSGPAADPNAVKKIFSLILDGKSIRKYGVEYQPTIVCVTSENYWEFSSAWELCQRAITAMWAVESEVVVLCPGFFASLKLSPSSDDCPKKSINHLQLIKSKLFDNQYVVLVQVLAQLYLSASGVPALWPPVLDVNSCLNLPESDAIRNPTSYAYYAASVTAECSQWPIPFQGRSGLEVDSGSGHETAGTVQLKVCPDSAKLGLCPPSGKSTPATLAR